MTEVTEKVPMICPECAHRVSTSGGRTEARCGPGIPQPIEERIKIARAMLKSTVAEEMDAKEQRARAERELDALLAEQRLRDGENR